MANIIPALAGAFILLMLSAFPASASLDCLDCHKPGGKGPAVNIAEYRASVHGGLPCGACHLGITSYPHGRASKVRCGICHFAGNRGAPTRQAREFRMSIHASAEAGGKGPTCSFCHGSHAILPSSDPRSRTNRFRIPALCANCHQEQFRRYRGSIHGKQLLDERNPAAATCFDCHLEHRTPAVNKPQWMLALIRECGTCHARQLETYRQTYHGRVTLLGYTTIATCVSCHGSHDILPPSDPASRLSPEHIVAACGTCHPGATRSFASFIAHPDETNRAKYPWLYYTYTFMTALLYAVFTFFGLHTILWFFRSLKERRRKREGG